MSREYTLYRYENADGTAKEWAYADIGRGVAEIRWGKAGALRQSQEKPMTEAVHRAWDKECKGYRRVGQVWLDASGNHSTAPPPPPNPARATTTTAQPAINQPPTHRKPGHGTARLGGADGAGWL